MGLEPLSLQRQRFYKLTTYEIVHLYKKKQNIQYLLTLQSLKLDQRPVSQADQILWTSHRMLRIASSISEGYMHEIVMEGEGGY